MQAQSVKIKQDRRKVFKAIAQHMMTLKDITDRSTLQKYLSLQEKSHENPMIALKANKVVADIFQQYVLQFFAWSDSFWTAAQKHNLQDSVKDINIQEKLIQLLPKVKSKNPNSTFIVPIITMVKKQFMFTQRFISTWRQMKENIRKQRIQKTQNSDIKQNPPVEKQTIQIKINQQQKEPIRQLETIKDKDKDKVKEKQKEKDKQKQKQKQKEKEKEKQRQKEKEKEKEKQKENKIERIKKLKVANELRFKKNKDNRFANFIKFLESKKEFNCLNKEGVAKEILNNLDRFMKDKLQKIIQATKIRSPGYVSDEAGDQFRLYSKRSNLLQFKHTATLPDNEMRILKVRYPSKLEKYIKLRECQEKKEEKVKNQMKQRLETDKKTEKILQSYVLTDEKQRNLHQFQQDEGPKRKQRLVISSQTLQYVFENDQWFNDLFIMERTFYRGST